MTLDGAHWDDHDRMQMREDWQLVLEQEAERAREHGPATDVDRALSGDRGSATGPTLLVAGAVLMGSQLFTLHPWQAVFALGLLLLIAGGVLIADG